VPKFIAPLISTIELAPVAENSIAVRAELEVEVIAPTMVVEPEPEVAVSDSSLAAAVPPIAPVVIELADPVELRAKVLSPVAVIIVPIVDAAPAALEKVSDSRAAALVILPRSSPALSPAVAVNVLVCVLSRPVAVRSLMISKLSEFDELMLITAAPVRSVTLAKVVSAWVIRSSSALTFSVSVPPATVSMLTSVTSPVSSVSLADAPSQLRSSEIVTVEPEAILVKLTAVVPLLVIV
jgi:hypothetical protein